MKKIRQDELFQSLSGFLKSKGIEFKDGAYAQRIQQACGLLGETINATQVTAKKAKDQVDKRLDQLRQSIHEATAPKVSQPAAPPPESPPAAAPAPKANSAAAAPPPASKKPKATRKRAAKRAKRQRK